MLPQMMGADDGLHEAGKARRRRLRLAALPVADAQPNLLLLAAMGCSFAAGVLSGGRFPSAALLVASLTSAVLRRVTRCSSERRASTTSTESLPPSEGRLEGLEGGHALAHLKDKLSHPGLRSPDILAAGVEAVVALFPAEVILSVSMATFVLQGGRQLLHLEQHVGTIEAADSLAAALSATAGAEGTSVAAACDAVDGTVVDSVMMDAGLDAFTDWRAGGLDSKRVLTVGLRSGCADCVGFLQVHFSAEDLGEPSWKGPLQSICAAVGNAIYVHHALSAVTATYTQLAPSAGASIVPDGELSALEQLDASAADDASLLSSWDMDPYTVAQPDIPRLLVSALHSLGLLRCFAIPPSAAWLFTNAVAAHMQDRPFHNLLHVLMVTSAAYRFLVSIPTDASPLDDLDALSLLLAAMVHDLEHPGHTNGFECSTSSERALRYNDVSVLENHSLTVGFRLLADSGILAVLSPADQSLVRRRLIASVLATDMSVHRMLMSRIDSQISAASERMVHEGRRRSEGQVTEAATQLRRRPSTSSYVLGASHASNSDFQSGEGMQRRSSIAALSADTQPAGPRQLLRRSPSTRRPRSSATAADAPPQPRRTSGSRAPSPSPAASLREERWSSTSSLPAPSLSAVFGPSDEDRTLLVSLLLHAADLGACLSPPPVCQRVVQQLQREFSAQASAEAERGLPVTVMVADSPASLARMERGFAECVTEPLYRRISGMLPASWGLLLERTAATRAGWAELAATSASPRE